MTLIEVFKKSNELKIAAAGTICLTALALAAGYNGQVLMEAGLAFVAGIQGGTTLMKAGILMNDKPAP